MIEARIECTCHEFNLADINLRLRRGDTAWVPEAVARGSVDLGLAVRSGAVSVVYARRCSVSRHPPPPASRIRSITRSVGRFPAPVPAPSADPVPTSTVDPKSIEDAIARGVTRAIADLVSSGVLVPGGQHTTTHGQASVVPSAVSSADPVYIPTNIVPTDGATIRVSESSTEGSDLETAAAALKATRRRKPPASSTENT